MLFSGRLGEHSHCIFWDQASDGEGKIALFPAGRIGLLGLLIDQSAEAIESSVADLEEVIKDMLDAAVKGM